MDELTLPSEMNCNPNWVLRTSVENPTPSTNKFSFRKEIVALNMNDANRLMWMVVRGHLSLLKRTRVLKAKVNQQIHTFSWQNRALVRLFLAWFQSSLLSQALRHAKKARITKWKILANIGARINYLPLTTVAL